MKKSVSVIFGGLLCASILSVSLISSFINESKDVEGYSTSTLPTTIDLNDTSASNIRSYYSSLNNLSQSERQGNNLLKNLKTILKNGQKYYSYDSGNAIWQIYEISDRDWEKSPASSTTYGTYNSSTKKITNYTYGTSSSSSKNNPYIHALYINCNVTNQTTAWDDHQQTQWGINREHVWPKAEGFETSGTGGARGDPMHLMAGNGYANNIHSNYYYGYVNTSSTYTNCGSKYSNVSGNLLGKSKTLGGSTNVFEPQDSDKGDIARAIFYMVARYNYLSGSDSDGIDSNNPNLSLTQQLSDWASSGYSSTTSKKGYMGIMTDLLAWHHADPVDEYEIHRNNILYTNYTNNRNPFIDFPEWADFIWGSVNYSGSTYISHSVTPTGYATPSSDTINGYNSGGSSTVSVTGVTLDENSIEVEEGNDATLTATVAPSNATNQTVTWSTSDASVATVSGGIVTGVNEGSATITVTTSDGGYTASCTVTVTESSSGGESEEGSYTWDLSKNTYDDDASANSVTWSSEIATMQTVRTDQTKTACNNYLGGDSNKRTSSRFYTGNSLVFTPSSGINITSVEMTATNQTYANALANSTWTNASASATTTEPYVVTITPTLGTSAFSAVLGGTAGFTSCVVNYDIPSASKTLTSITLDTEDVEKNFLVDDEFNYDDLSVTAHYSDGSSDIIAPTSVSTPDMSTVGEKTVTVSYTESEVTVNATYTITVNSPNPTSISATVNKTFLVGETISTSDIVVTDNLDNIITSFAFANDGYRFTYQDANSGGSLTNKTFTDSIVYNNLVCSLTVQVKREARSDIEDVSDHLTRDLIGVTGSSYESWSGIYDTSNARYSGQTSGLYENQKQGVHVESVQVRSTNSNSGIVSTVSGGRIKSVEITFNSFTVAGRTLNIYGKNTAYTSITQLYSEQTSGTKVGTIVQGTSTKVTFDDSYSFVGIRSNSNTIYIDEIIITYYGFDTAVNVSNYIMYEDTANQCTSKLSTAIDYLNNLSSSELTTFTTSNDYVVSTARERLEAWARSQGKIVNYTANDVTLQSNNTVSMFVGSPEANNMIAILLVASFLCSTALTTVIVVKKRKRMM